jgi:hypothetical protein
MWGLAPVAAAAMLLFADKVELDASVTSESRAGQAPIVAGQAPGFSLVELVTPALALRLFDDHDLQLRLDYGLRIFARATEGLPLASPLILHTVTLSAKARLSPVLTSTAAANLSVGAADYSYLPQLLGTNQSTLPYSVDIFSTSGSLDTQLRLDPRWTLSGVVEAAYSKPISSAPPNASDMSTLIPYPRRSLLGARSALVTRASRTDDVILTVGAQYQTISSVGLLPASDPNQVSVASGRFVILTVWPQLGWRTRLSPRQELHFTAGVVYNHILVNPTGQHPQPLAPTGAFDFTINVMSHNDVALRVVGGTGVDYFVDPILGTTGLRGQVSSGFYLAFPPDWTAGLEASFATPLSRADAGLLNATMLYPDETAASVTLPLRHRLSRNVLMDFGGLWSNRGPRLSAPNWAFHQRQLWVYFALTFTTREIPRWSRP